MTTPTTLTDSSAPSDDRVYSTESVRAAGERSTVLERQISTDPSRFRVLTGERPTGALHLGHLIATLDNVPVAGHGR